MKTVSIILLTILAICFSCKKEVSESEPVYISMQFEREGGGQISFNIVPNSSLNLVNVQISEIDFQDTLVQLSINDDITNTTAFSSLNKALKNQIEIKGSFTQSDLLTGTWAFVYLVSVDGSKTEITNTNLRDSLMIFEEAVREKISDIDK